MMMRFSGILIVVFMLARQAGLFLSGWQFETEVFGY